MLRDDSSCGLAHRRAKFHRLPGSLGWLKVVKSTMIHVGADFEETRVSTWTHLQDLLMCPAISQEVSFIVHNVIALAVADRHAVGSVCRDMVDFAREGNG